MILKVYKGLNSAVSPEQNPNFFPTKYRCGMNRSATASLHSATPKKNVSYSSFCFGEIRGGHRTYYIIL